MQKQSKLKFVHDLNYYILRNLNQKRLVFQFEDAQ